MKVWKRILIKTLLFAVVAAAAGAGGVAWKESSRDTARYALEQYAQHLIDQENAAEQLSLFQPSQNRQRDKLEHLERTVDAIRERYGTSAIVLGSVAAGTELCGSPKSNEQK